MLSHPLSFYLKLPVLTFVYLISNCALAQVYNSSVSAAVGGTGRAAVEVGDATFLNPATVAHLNGRFLYGSFAENEWAASLSDSTKDSLIAGALSFVSKKTDVVGGRMEESNIGMSLAEFIVDKWSFGFTANYREQKLNEDAYRQVNADLGFLYTPRSDLGIALVGYNVFGEDKNAPEILQRKASVGLGFNYVYLEFARIRLDVTTESQYMVGIESYLNRFIITRFGYQNDSDDKRELLTAGVGFHGPRFGVNYAYQGNRQNSGDYRHSVDLVIPF